ncbi:MAG: Slp family lipoprotein [Dokdonella sp.]
MRNSMFLALIATGLVSCASVPTSLQGQFASDTPAQAVRSGAAVPIAQSVRWGGEIIKVDPGQNTTCFEVLGRQLDATARPIKRDASEGRFVACKEGFYDPEVYTRGREVTVVGALNGTKVGRVGEFDYTYPKVDANTVYLWPPKRERTEFYGYPGFYGPGFYDPFWGGPFGWGPYFGGPRVIVVHPTAPPPPMRRASGG